MNKKEYKAWVKRTPRVVAAGVLFFDADDKILFVKPTYKEGWEIPGGITELDESPRDACKREIKEELGLNLEVGRLICVGYGKKRKNKPERVSCIFDGGILTKIKIKKIKLQSDELLEYKFLSFREAKPLLVPALKQKVWHALRVRDKKIDPYIEHED